LVTEYYGVNKAQPCDAPYQLERFLVLWRAIRSCSDVKFACTSTYYALSV